MPKGPSREEVPGGGLAPHGRVWGEKKNQGAKRKRRKEGREGGRRMEGGNACTQSYLSPSGGSDQQARDSGTHGPGSHIANTPFPLLLF